MNEQSDLSLDIGITMQKLNRQLARVETDFQKAALRQERAFIKANDKIAKDFERLARDANRSMSKIQMPGLGAVGGAVAGFMSARELVRMTDAWTDLSSRVGLAVGDMERAPEVMSRISEMARRTYSSLESTAESWLANSTALRELGMTTNESLDFTEALNNALVVSGAKAQRAASVQDALAKAMALGKLSGDQLNTVIASGGRVAELLATQLGVTVNQLRKVGGEGRITGDVIDKALRGNLAMLRDEAESMPATISDGFLLLKNALLEYVGATDQGLEASGKLAAALVFLADNIDLVIAAGGVLVGRVLGPAMLSMLAGLATALRGAAAAMATTARSAGAATAALTGLRAALAFVGGPVGLVLAGLTALPLVTRNASERAAEMKQASSDAAAALDQFANASDRAKKEQSGLAGEVSRATANILTQSRVSMQEALRSLEDARGGMLENLGSGAVLAGPIEEAIRALEPAARAGANFNRSLASIRSGLAGLKSGKTDVAQLVAEMERLASIGDEATDLADEIERGFSAGVDTRALREAQRALVAMAESAGGFGAELEAISSASTADEQQRAFVRLLEAVRETAQAGGVLRRDLFKALRDGLSDLSENERATLALKAALQGNLDLAREIMSAGDPFAATTAGANNAATSVRSLTQAYQEYARSRQEGERWANSREGLEAGYVAARTRGAGSQDEELVRAVVAVSERLGIAAKDLLAVMSFETGGKLRPDTMGPRTKWGQHFGLIQFGEPQGARYGVTPQSSITEQVEAAGRYLVDAGVKAGDSLANVYAAVLSGNARNVTASDLAAGGVISNVSDAVGGDQFVGHIARAEALLNAYGGVVAEVVEAEKDAVDAAKKVAEAAEDAAKARADLIAQSQRQIADQQFELNMIGRSASEQAKLRAEYILTNEARAAGILLTERVAGSERTYGEVIAENAARVGEYVAAQERMAKAVENTAQRQQFMQQVQDNLKNGLLDAIVAGNSFADTLANVAQMLAKAYLQAALFNEGVFASPNGGQGALGALFSSVFGGFRASGGPVASGRSYVVGERGPEMFVPKTPGTIIPNHALGQGGGRMELVLHAPEGFSAEQTQAISNISLRVADQRLGQFARNVLPRQVQHSVRNPREV